MDDHLVGPYIQRLPADHLQTKKRQRVFAAFLGLPAGGGNRACCISKIPRLGKVADSFGNHLNARDLQPFQGKVCTRKPIQRMEKIKSSIFAKEFLYILRQSLQRKSESDTFSKP
ncbi:hypothetical protein [Heyndrickxia coagulans]|jgi:hypothetical protein|uniref:hypothetical protein n=1 Tax=Heyndrickxia coagulans TaxID=1398 RepID=UPI0018239D9A|nr:hypothetical protein [Heyndrickxia coagulans]NWN94895.1 hypothetical protein [Bacillus sp. (in: firmicutes)]